MKRYLIKQDNKWVELNQLPIKYLVKTTDKDWVETTDLSKVNIDKKYEFPVIYAFKPDETGDYKAFYYEYVKFGRRIYVDLQ